jgi:hypothetical protein
MVYKQEFLCGADVVLHRIVVILQAEGQVVVVLVGVSALGDLAHVVLVRRVTFKIIQHDHM